MNTATHTPGPWMAKLTEDGDEDTGGYGTYSPNGEVIPLPTDDDNDPEPICTMYSFNPADLILIAAAPDLLAACEAMAKAKDLLGLMGAQMHAREAIKKAK